MTTGTIVRREELERVWSSTEPGFLVDLQTGEMWTADRGRKPTSCPYCGSTRISAHVGYWECRDCGQSGSY